MQIILSYLPTSSYISLQIHFMPRYCNRFKAPNPVPHKLKATSGGSIQKKQTFSPRSKGNECSEERWNYKCHKKATL